MDSLEVIRQARLIRMGIAPKARGAFWRHLRPLTGLPTIQPGALGLFLLPKTRRSPHRYLRGCLLSQRSVRPAYRVYVPETRVTTTTASRTTTILNPRIRTINPVRTFKQT